MVARPVDAGGGHFFGSRPFTRVGFVLRCFLTVVGILIASPSWAQDCSGPTRIVVGFPPGGGLDSVARIVAERWTARTGRTVIVENRAGADGGIAANFVGRTPANGCTLIIRGSEHHMLTFLRQNPGYLLEDFVPVANLATQPLVILANPDAPFKSVAGLVEYAKANPGKLRYGASAVGGPSHLAMALFMRATKTDMVLVQYKGASLANIDTASGILPLSYSSVSAAMPMIAAGKLTPVMISTPGRWAGLPDLPTATEAGYPDATFNYWTGLLAPAATPRELREKINAEMQAILQEPAVREKMIGQGLIPASSSLPDFEKLLQEDLRLSGVMAKELDLKPE